MQSKKKLDYSIHLVERHVGNRQQEWRWGSRVVAVYTLALANNEPIINHLVTTKSSQYVVGLYTAEYGNANTKRVAERSSAERSPRLSQQRAWLRMKSWAHQDLRSSHCLPGHCRHKSQGLVWKIRCLYIVIKHMVSYKQLPVHILHQTKSGIVTILVDPPSTDMFYLSLPSFVLSTFSRSLRDTHVN